MIWSRCGSLWLIHKHVYYVTSALDLRLGLASGDYTNRGVIGGVIGEVYVWCVALVSAVTHSSCY